MKTQRIKKFGTNVYSTTPHRRLQTIHRLRGLFWFQARTLMEVFSTLDHAHRLLLTNNTETLAGLCPQHAPLLVLRKHPNSPLYKLSVITVSTMMTGPLLSDTKLLMVVSKKKSVVQTVL
jgi:hypothetical protein